MDNEVHQASYKDDVRARLTLCYQTEDAELEAVSDMDHWMHNRGQEAVEEPRLAIGARSSDVRLIGEDVFLDDLCHAHLLQQVSEVRQVGIVVPALILNVRVPNYPAVYERQDILALPHMLPKVALVYRLRRLEGRAHVHDVRLVGLFDRRPTGTHSVDRHEVVRRMTVKKYRLRYTLDERRTFHLLVVSLVIEESVPLDVIVH